MDDDRVMHAMSIDDMYHVERVLARGVGGVTELVTIEGSGPFVRKKIPRDQANRSVWSTCADCGSRRLPHVEALYELPDEFVVVYDFVPGESLDRLVSSGGALPQERAVSLATDLCEAVGALHACGIIHRDLSPNNVIVAADGAHLIDLGIARMRKDGVSHDSNSLGTWGYASPEQYGFAQTDSRSDVYGIGRLLGYMVTGVSPADDGYDTVLRDERIVPPALRAVIERACAFEPSARYQGAGEMAAALANLESPEAGAGQPGRANSVMRDEDSGTRQVRPGRMPDAETGTREAGVAGTPGKQPRKRGLVVAIACVVAVLVLGAGVFFFLNRGGSGGDSTSTTDSGTQGGVISRETQGTGSTGSAGGTGTTGTPSATGAASGTSASDFLEVGGLEWNVTPDGTVIYLLSLTNTSDSLTVELPAVTLTGLDAGGNVTFSEDVTFSVAYPGETVSMANIVDGGGTADVTASAVTTVTSPKQVSEDERLTLVTGSVNRKTDSLGSPVVTGLVTLVSGTDGGYSGLRVDVVERDDEGRLVGYGCDYPSMPAEGSSTSFSTLSVVDSASSTSYEVYVNPW